LHRSQYQCEPALGQISLDLLPQEGRIAIHERLVLLDRDMRRQVAQRERFLHLEAEISPQSALARAVAEGVLGQFLQGPGLIDVDACG
jgi:hypothetical protein